MKSQRAWLPRLLAPLAVVTIALVVSGLPAAASATTSPSRADAVSPKAVSPGTVNAKAAGLPVRNATLRFVSSGLYLDAYEAADNQGFLAVTRGNQNNDTQRWIIRPLDRTRGTYVFVQASSGRRLGLVKEMSTTDTDLGTYRDLGLPSSGQVWYLVPRKGYDIFGQTAYQFTNYANGCALSAYDTKADNWRAKCVPAEPGTGSLWVMG
jgi:hypothetical protein